MRRIAVIGCGAIADRFHIPALKKVAPDARVVLVDPDADRAAALAAKHGIRETARSHEEVAGRVDAAVIASPHDTHVPIALDLVDASVPVLSEKPLGTTVAEVEALRDAARAKNVTVAVNQTRRFIPACQEVRRRVQSGAIGDVVAVEAREGDRFDWPATTPSMFGARSRGRGLLLDMGAHVLDLMVWWFGPELQVVDYADDSFGGSEASVRVVLQAGKGTIRIRLSWLARQVNRYDCVGTRGSLAWAIHDLDRVTLDQGRGPKALTLPGPASFADLGPLVVGDFLQAIERGSSPLAGPDDVLPSLRLIETCYGRRRRMDVPGHGFELEPAPPALRSR